jgi:hypothetical protein
VQELKKLASLKVMKNEKQRGKSLKKFASLIKGSVKREIRGAMEMANVR